jgi:predicted dienelactone hydrolase
MLWWERATDLTRVLDRLHSDPQFGSLVDASRVGAAGFSLGGYSVAAMAGARTSLAQWETFCRSVRRDATCDAQPEFPEAMAEFDTIGNRSDVQESMCRHGDSFHDRRFKAIFAMAPVVTWLTDDSLEQVTVPVRVVVGSEDLTAPQETNAKRIAAHVPGAQLSVLANVGHYTFLAECADLGVKELPHLCHEQPGVDRGAIHRAVASDAVAFFNEALGPR